MDEQVAALVDRVGPDFALRTRHLGGYGLALLESGANDERCSASLYYGCASGGSLGVEALCQAMSPLAEQQDSPDPPGPGEPPRGVSGMLGGSTF